MMRRLSRWAGVESACCCGDASISEKCSSTKLYSLGTISFLAATDIASIAPACSASSNPCQSLQHMRMCVVDDDLQAQHA